MHCVLHKRMVYAFSHASRHEYLSLKKIRYVGETKPPAPYVLREEETRR